MAALAATTAPPHLLREEEGDLFDVDSSYCLAHCVSADLHMGKGIATIFRKEFGRVDELQAQRAEVGSIAVLKDSTFAATRKKHPFVYYLVTKSRYFHRPTYDSLQASLQEMRKHMLSNGCKRLAVPRIGAGLDELNWDRVKEIIRDTFPPDLGIEILVKYIPQPRERRR